MLKGYVVSVLFVVFFIYYTVLPITGASTHLSICVEVIIVVVSFVRWN